MLDEGKGGKYFNRSKLPSEGLLQKLQAGSYTVLY
jgi:hypothetical protein